MTFLWKSNEKHPERVNAYGTESWVTFSRPSGTPFGESTSHTDSKARLWQDKTFLRFETKAPRTEVRGGTDKEIWCLGSAACTVFRLVYLATCQLLPFITSES